MKFAAVVNAKAGAASRLGIAPARLMIEERLGSSLGSLRIVPPRALKPALDEAAASKPDAILVLGGDGTARSAASHLYRAGIPCAFLPGGTMNILPKRLYGETPLEAVLDALAAGQIEEIELETGLAGEETFFVAASFGFLPILATAREQYRRGSSPLDSVRVGARVMRFTERIFAAETRYRVPDGAPGHCRALLVSLGCADLLHPWRKPDVPFDSFECVCLNVESLWSTFGLAMKALALADWRSDPRVENFQTKAIEVLGPYVRMTLDGEPLRVPGPLSVRVAKTGLRALALKSAQEHIECTVSSI